MDLVKCVFFLRFYKHFGKQIGLSRFFCNGDWKPENGDQKPENGDRKPEIGTRVAENGSRVLENGVLGPKSRRL